ncbi:NnrS family protein [Thiohalophilus sp.]|uniref:NnrS family protein n=1 Tax=Thiohalophilus sp. TaxID=3028392 RepID=UPI002ACEC625|nr:NnrS family protein [Thiohalophilus sp.]MDZ7805220.1 NnrS family protein [Thiohalophilus sp.]
MSLNPEQLHSGQCPRFALWQLGFRPFFLLAGLSAVILMAFWLLIYFQYIPAPYFANPAFWHSHELLFGYATAVIAGFLLTAVRNWTGRQTLTGVPLMWLALLWLAGRLAIASAAWLPAMLVLIVDVAFLPVLALAIAVPLWRARQMPNLLIFISLLGLMMVANLLTHLEHTFIGPLAGSGIQMMVFLIMILIAVMAGRVVPFFIERGIGGIKLKQNPWLERLGVLSLIAYALVSFWQPQSPVGIWLAALAFVLNALRWWSWHHPALWRIPMLWVLHLAYLWLVLSLLFAVLAGLGWIPAIVEVHAFTLGTLGLITLGMMARVSQGHSGRTIGASRVTTIAFICLLLAAIIRVVGGILGGSGYSDSIVTSAAFWLVAFGLFVIEYIPILIKPRVDGQPG